MATITSLGFSIFSRYDGTGVSRARRDLNDLNSQLEKNTGGLNTFTGRMDAMITAALAAGPALVPIGAAALAIASGLTAAAGAAGAAAGVWAYAAKSAMAMTSSAVKAADNLRQQKAILAGLTPGTKAYADQLIKVQQAQGQLNAAMAALNPVQQQYVKSVESLKVAWQGFIQQTSSATLGPISTVLGVIAQHMGALVPLTRAVGEVAQSVANQFKQWADNGGIDRFVKLIQQYGVPVLNDMVTIGKNLLGVLGDGFRAFLPLGLNVVDALTRGSTALRTWADGGGFQRFLAYVRANGPQVKQWFLDLVGALKNVAIALKDMGPFALTTTGIILKLVAAMPPDVIRAVAYAFVALKVAILGLSIANSIATGVGFLVTALSGLAVASDLTAAGMYAMLLPIGLIVLAVAAVGVAIYLLATHWSTVWNGIKIAFDAVVEFLRSKLGLLVLALGPIGAIAWIAANWSLVWGTVRNVAATVWGWLETTWRTVSSSFATAWQAVGGALSGAWSAVWGAVRAAGQAVWSAMQTAWQAVCSAFSTIWQAVGGALSGAWGAVWNAVKAVGQAVWSAMQTAWQAVCSAFSTIWGAVSGALSGAWGAAWNAIKAVGQAVWSAMQTAWQTVLSAMQTVWNTVGGAINTAWSTIWNGIKTVGTTIWSAIQTAWQTALSAMQTIWNTVGGAISTAWNSVWNGIKTAGTTIWDAIKTAWNTAINTLKTTWDSVGGALKKAWDDVWNGIKNTASSIWNGIKTAVRDGINGVIGLVNGLIDAWDKIVGAVGLGGTLNIGKISPVSFATGGYVQGPGTGTSDSIPARLSNGEYVIKADAVRAYGVGTMDAINSMAFANGGLVGGYAAGGPVLPGLPSGVTSTFNAAPAGAATGGTGPTPTAKKHTGILGTGIGPNIGPAIPGASIVGSAIKGAIDTAKLVLGFIGEAAIHTMLDPLVNAIAGTTPMGKIAAEGFKKLGKAMVDLLIKKDAEAKPKIGGVIPSGQHLAIIDAALAAAGVPPPGDKASWETGLNTLITRESNWNAGAINNTDSNAAAGIPSQGLAQVIPPTFAAYHVAGTSNNILDPVANVAAAIRYIVARYGNITNVQQANANLPPKGYYLGTQGATAGWHRVGENGPEWVKFRGGEKVRQYGKGPDTVPASNGGDGDVHVNCEIHVHGDVTKDGVAKMKNELVPQIRMAVEAGVGRKRRR